MSSAASLPILLLAMLNSVRDEVFCKLFAILIAPNVSKLLLFMYSHKIVTGSCHCGEFWSAKMWPYLTWTSTSGGCLHALRIGLLTLPLHGIYLRCYSVHFITTYNIWLRRSLIYLKESIINYIDCLSEETTSVPKANTVSEHDFARLLQEKPNVTILSLKTMILFKKEPSKCPKAKCGVEFKNSIKFARVKWKIRVKF